MAKPVNTTEIKESPQSDVNYKQTGGVKTAQAETTAVEMPKDAPSTAATAADNLREGESQGYTGDERSMTEGADAAGQMNRITSEASPMMRQARQEGMLAAAKRGLGNSSIAAGSAQAAATKAALPLAQQTAANEQQQAIANQAAANRAEEFSAAEANKMETTNVQAATQATLQDAAEQNKMTMQYDDQAFKAAVTNATEENKAAMQKFSGDQEIMQTWLSGEISKNLAHLNGQYQQVITADQVAAQMYGNTLDSLAQMWANPDVPMKQKNAFATSAMNFLEGGLKVTASITNMDFKTAMPG